MEQQDIFNATLVEREDLHDELAIFKIKYNDGPVPEFKPGQFCTLGLPQLDDAGQPVVSPRTGKVKLLRRAYSIASSPNEGEHLELFLVLVEDGAMTPRLWKLSPGDPIWMDRRIMGEFTLDGVPDGKDLVMISTGTGLAPFVSMMRTERGTGRWRKLVIVHGVRYAPDLGYREELQQVAAEDPSVVYLAHCTREPDDSDWKGLRGRIQPILQDEAGFEELTGGVKYDPEQTHFFLCGNPEMIEQVQQLFEARGFVTQTKKTPGNIHFERYW